LNISKISAIFLVLTEKDLRYTIFEDSFYKMPCGRTYEMRGIAKNHNTAIVLRHRADPLDSLIHNMIISDHKKIHCHYRIIVWVK
jgi:hypothetical protein